MVEETKLKVGTLVWWSGRKQLNTWVHECWNLPCVVTEVAERSFRVKRLDSFVVSESLEIHSEENPLLGHGLRFCTPADVKRYIHNYTRLLEVKIAGLSRSAIQTEESLAEVRRQIKCYRTQSNEFLQELSNSKEHIDSALS